MEGFHLLPVLILSKRKTTGSWKFLFENYYCLYGFKYEKYVCYIINLRVVEKLVFKKSLH